MFDHDDHGDHDDRDDHDESSHLSHSRLRNIFSVSSRCYWHQPPPGRNDKSHPHMINIAFFMENNDELADDEVHQRESKKLQLEADPFSAK